MSKNYCTFVGLVVAIAVIGFVANVQAGTLLFSDNFNGADNSIDYGLNDNLAARQAGATLGTVPWARDHLAATLGMTGMVQVNNAARAPNMLLLQNTDTTPNNFNYTRSALIQHDLAADSTIATAGGFTARFTINPMAVEISGNEHRGIHFILGADDGTQSYAGNTGNPYIGGLDTQVDLGLNFQGTGTLTVLSHSGTWVSGLSYDSTRAGNYDRMYTFEVRVETVDFAPGTTGSATLWMGTPGTPSNLLTQVDLDTNSANGMTPFTWEWRGEACYMGFGPYFPRLDGYGFVDDVMVGTGANLFVPEPSTLALLAAGLIGLLAYAWRKRK